jgi:hypothetical protein
MNSWAFLHRWYMPFVFITAAWCVAVPAAVYLQQGLSQSTGEEIGLAYGTSWVLRDDYLATIVVYLLNIGAAVWFFDQDGSTRWAAFWATAVGLSRIVLPIALTASSDVTVAGNQHYIDWDTMRIVLWFQDLQMLVLGVMVWGIFARFVGETGGAVSHAGHYAEA